MSEEIPSSPENKETPRDLFSGIRHDEPETKPLFEEKPSDNTVGPSVNQDEPKPLFADDSAQESVPVTVPSEEKKTPSVPAVLRDDSAPLPEKSAVPEMRSFRPAVPERKKSVQTTRTVIRIDPDSTTLGGLMAHAREQAGFKLEDVSKSTRIKLDYLADIEKDCYDKLPAGIFPSAYIRRLCEQYSLDEASGEMIMNKLHETMHPREDVPSALLTSLEENVQRNEDEDRRARRIFYGIAFAGTILLLTFCAGILMLVLHFKTPVKTAALPSAPGGESVVSSSVPVSGFVSKSGSFDSGKLEKLTPPRIPAMRELKVPR